MVRHLYLNGFFLKKKSPYFAIQGFKYVNGYDIPTNTSLIHNLTWAHITKVSPYTICPSLEEAILSLSASNLHFKRETKGNFYTGIKKGK